MAEGFGQRFDSKYGDDKKSKVHYLRSQLPFLDHETLNDMLTEAKGDVEQILRQLGGESELKADSELQNEGMVQGGNGNLTSNFSDEVVRARKDSQQHKKKFEFSSLGPVCFNQPSFNFGRGTSKSRELVPNYNHESYPTLCSSLEEGKGSIATMDHSVSSSRPRPAPVAVIGQYDDFSSSDYQDSAFSSYEESVPSVDEAFDSVPLQLDSSVIEKLFSEYSNPFGNLDVKTLPVRDLQIQIPRKLAFDLYLQICSNLMDKVPLEGIALNGSAAADNALNELRDAGAFSDVNDENPKNVVKGEEAGRNDTAGNDLTSPENEASPQQPQGPEVYRRLALIHQEKGRECEMKIRQRRHSRGTIEYFCLLSAEHFKKRDELDEEAKNIIFRKHNGTDQPLTRLDLHHLYVREALPILRSFLENHKEILKESAARSVELNIICGRGNHSNNNEPKILPAVVEYLVTNGYPFRKRDGHVIVHLRRT